MPVHRQRREKPRDLVLAHLQGMALPMEQDKPLDPADIYLLRPHTIMPQPDRLPDLIEQLGFVPCGSVRYANNTLE